MFLLILQMTVAMTESNYFELGVIYCVLEIRSDFAGN